MIFLDKNLVQRGKKLSNLEDFLKEVVGKYSHYTAVTTKETKRSYRQLGLEVGCIRGVLINVDLSGGKNFGILMSNSIDSVKTFLAVTTLGHTAVLLHESIDGEGLIKAIKDFDIGCVIFDMKFNETVRYARRNSDGNIFLTASNLFDEYVDAASDIDPESIAVIMMAEDGTGEKNGYKISHKSLVEYAKQEYEIHHNMVPGLKSIVLLSVTRPLGLIRSFLTGLNCGANLFFCRNEENMFGNLLYFKPDFIVLTQDLAEKLIIWLNRDNVEFEGLIQNVIIESSEEDKGLALQFEKYGIAVSYNYFENDEKLLEKLQNGGE